MKLINMGKGLNHVVRLDLLNENSIIVDAGVAHGKFIDKLREYPETKHSRIIGVECNQSNLEILRTKNYLNVELADRALVGNGYEPTIEFTEFIAKDNKYYEWGNIYSLREKQASKNPKFMGIKKYKVKTITLYELMDIFNLKHIHYLKMDVENAEHDIIMSLHNRPASQISFELHDEKELKPITNKLESLGYSVQVFREEVFAIEVTDNI